MGSQTRNPTSQVEYTGTWDKTTSMWTYVDDHPDSATPPTDFLAHGTTAGYLTLGYGTAFSIPSTAINIVVKLNMYVYKPSGGACSTEGRIGVGGNKYNSGSPYTMTTTNTLVSWSWTQNPKTVAAWTVNDINGVGANALDGMGTYSTDANPLWRIGSIQLEVTYGEVLNGAAAVTGSATCTAVADRWTPMFAALSAAATASATGTIEGGVVHWGAAVVTATASSYSMHRAASWTTDYLTPEILDHVLGKGARNWTPPTQLYLSLHTGQPTGLNEQSGNGYGRQGVRFGAATNDLASSDCVVGFNQATADWSNLTHWGLWDAVTSGNLLLWGRLMTTTTVLSGKNAKFSLGEIRVGVD